MTEEKRRSISYLVRLWQIKSGGQLVWRISVESPQTGRRQGFVNLAELSAYLAEEMHDGSSRAATHRY